MDVSTAADLVQVGLGRERSEQPMTQGHSAHGVAELHLVVGGTERVGVLDGDLLLTRAVLVDRLLGHHSLGRERIDHLDHESCSEIVADRAVDGSVVGVVVRHVAAVDVTREVVLVLEAGHDCDAMVGGTGDHRLEIGTRARTPVCAVVVQLVTQDAGAPRCPRKHAEGCGVRHEADLTDWLHALDVDHLFEQVDRHLRTGQVHSLHQLGLEGVDVNRLRACDAADIAVLEPDQLHARVTRARQDRPVVHESPSRSRRKA